MSSNQGPGVAETIHLTEQTFDEALLATRGLVMIDFWAGGAARAGRSRPSSRRSRRPRKTG
jgi:hypothetical protein